MESNYKQILKHKGWITEEYRNYTHYKLVALKDGAEFSHLTDNICFETYEEKEKEFNRTWKLIYEQICNSSSNDKTEFSVNLSKESLSILDRWAADEECSRSEFLNDLLLKADALQFLYSDLTDVHDTSIDYKKKMEDFGLTCTITEEEFYYHFEARSKDNMWGGSHTMFKMDIERAKCSKEHAFRMGWKEVYMDIVRYFGRIF